MEEYYEVRVEEKMASRKKKKLQKVYVPTMRNQKICLNLIMCKGGRIFPYFFPYAKG